MGTRTWRFYQLDAEGKFYTDLGGSPMGFSVEKINGLASMNSVLFAQSLKTLKKEIASRDFIRKYGAKQKEEFDFSCPECGWQFIAPSHIGDDFYNTFVEENQMRIKCLCGCDFHASIEYVVTPKVQIKTL